MNALCSTDQYGSATLASQYSVMGPYMKSPTLSDIGRAGWTLLHTAAAAYDPRTERESMRAWIQSFGTVFPCKQCGNEYNADLLAHPLTDNDLRSSFALRVWVAEKHNRVNARLGKVQFPLTRVIPRWGGPTHPSM